MKNSHYLALLLSICLVQGLWAQVDQEVGFQTHAIKHTLFVCPDTAYELTRVIYEDYGLGFCRGFLRPDDFYSNGMAVLSLVGKDSIGPARVVRYELLPGMDTLGSPFSGRDYPAPYPVSCMGREGMEDLLREDAFHAYLVRAFGVDHLDTAVVYSCGPIDDPLEGIRHRYVLYTIEGWRTSTPKVNYRYGQMSKEGFHLLNEGTVVVPEKEMKRIRKSLVVYSNSSWGSYIFPGDRGLSSMLIVADRKVVATDYGLRCRARGRERPGAVSWVPFMLGRYSRIPPQSKIGSR